MTVDEAFRVLEVPPGSSLADVERSYRKLCRVWHPDRFGADAFLPGISPGRESCSRSVALMRPDLSE
jgi:DnaJ-domain-containing protein 1